MGGRRGSWGTSLVTDKGSDVVLSLEEDNLRRHFRLVAGIGVSLKTLFWGTSIGGGASSFLALWVLCTTLFRFRSK